jgi:hypothetical protein
MVRIGKRYSQRTWEIKDNLNTKKTPLIHGRRSVSKSWL